MDRRKMDFISELDTLLPKIQLEGQFFLRERLSNNQIYGALTTYARGVNPNSIIGMTCSNELYDGTEGILFTTSALYCSDVEFPNGKHGNIMILYRDLVSATASGSFLVNANINIEVKNLPFTSFQIKDMTIEMKALESVIDYIVSFMSSGFECDNDRKPSYANIIFYTKKKEKCMREVFNSIANGVQIQKRYCSCMDGLGLTALHYCLFLGNEYLAIDIAPETLKFYSDMYLNGQPFGFFNYCYIAAYKEQRKAFKTIYEGSAKMVPIMQRKKAQIKNKRIIRAVDMATNLIPLGQVVNTMIDLARNKIEDESIEVDAFFEDDFDQVYWEECQQHIMEEKNNPIESDDPRVSIIKSFYVDAEQLKNRMYCTKKIVFWNKRYLYLTDEEIEHVPVWKKNVILE